MARRKRLDLSTLAPLETKSLGEPPEGDGPFGAPPPIAGIAGEAAAHAGADAVIREMEAARAGGRLILEVPLEAIDPDHLVRDRVRVDDEEMAALIASIRQHGQRSPVELVDRGAEANPRYGLISGWRRVQALRQIAEDEASPRPVLGLIRTPRDAEDAYVAMVEENEIRADLSYYERARIAVRAAEAGAFDSAAAAVDTLFAAGSKARRSKIRSFITLYETLGAQLRFGADIPERLGLALVQCIRKGGGNVLRAALRAEAENAPAEAEALGQAMKAFTRELTAHGLQKPKARPAEMPRPGLSLKASGQGAKRRITLEGPGLTGDLENQIRALLAQDP